MFRWHWKQQALQIMGMTQRESTIVMSQTGILQISAKWLNNIGKGARLVTAHCNEITFFILCVSFNFQKLPEDLKGLYRSSWILWSYNSEKIDDRKNSDQYMLDFVNPGGLPWNKLFDIYLALLLPKKEGEDSSVLQSCHKNCHLRATWGKGWKGWVAEKIWTGIFEVYTVKAE